MILAKKSLVESEISTLTTMMAYSNSPQNKAQSTLDILNKAVAVASEEQTNKTKEAMKTRDACFHSMASSGHPNDVCKNLTNDTGKAVDITFTKADVNLQYQSTAFALNSGNGSNSFLQSRVSTLRHELAELEDELKRTEPYLGPVIGDTQDLNQLRNETEQNLDDEWLQFQYNSESESTSSSRDSSSLNVATGLSVGVPGMSFGLGFNMGKGDTDLKMAISKTSVKISGELLRVTIKRPWFKPSIFEDESLYFVSIYKAVYIQNIQYA